jgi:capsular polysaccharide biosynthesis protein
MFGLADEPSRLRTFDLLSLRRRWKFIGICAALSLIAVLLVLALKPKTYTAATQLLVYVREIHLGPEPVVAPGSADLVQVQNEIEIIRSRSTLTSVVQTLGLVDDGEFVPASSLQGIAAGTSDVRLDLAVGALKRRITVKRSGASHTILVSATTSDARKSEQIANAIGRVAVEARVGVDQESGRPPLRRQRLQGLGPSVYVMTAAGVPARPDGPRKIVIVPAAAAFGAAFGAVLVLLMDFRNATVRRAAQVESLGLECLGPAPLLQRRGPKAAREVATGREPVADLSDESEFLSNPMFEQTLRRVRVAIENAPARIIGISSAVAGEGVTRIAIDLVRACRGRKVLFVEARSDDLPLPQRSGSFKTESPLGVPGNPAWRMRCGPDCPDDYDLIVVSLPPLELGPEFRIAARNVDAILLVVKWGVTELQTIERAMAISGVSPADVVGAVLNMVDEGMIGKFGDKFWKAEATVAARRASFAFNAGLLP